MLAKTHMESIKQTYRLFLQNNFAGLKLRKPLFYSWDYGLRFDLQDKKLKTSDDEYFAEAVRRAAEIFETVFAGSDRIIFVFMDYKWRRRKIRHTNYAFRQIDNLDKSEIFYTKEASVYYQNDAFNFALIKLTADRINYKNILTAIAHSDFSPRRPRLDNYGMFTDKAIFFFNLDKKLIFHMYDDRGLDVIAADKEILRPIYKKHNDLILDYDRERIDKQFK